MESTDTQTGTPANTVAVTTDVPIQTPRILIPQDIHHPIEQKAYDQIDNPALIAANKFVFKSLCDFSCNIAIGCAHKCAFCYVPSTSTIKQELNLEKVPGLIPQRWSYMRGKGLHWADFEWGNYVFIRSWDEKAFLKSLRSAQRAKDRGKLSSDGNGAIMFCTTTDPYQTLVIPGNPAKSALLNAQRRSIVRRALELILTHSDLNVRILTRSPLAQEDFELFRAFGPRLLFGMSLPTMDASLSAIYEPNAPRPAAKFRTLEKAVEAGLHVYVALAPSLPDQSEEELRSTIEKIMTLNPVTLFHEPINLRAENAKRIEAKANELGRSINSAVFQTREAWREYAFNRFSLVDKICNELGVPNDILHQWPDPDLASKAGFMKMKKMQELRDMGSTFTKALREEAEYEWQNGWLPWLQYWHNPAERISAWPQASVRHQGTELSGILPLVPSDPDLSAAA